MAEKLNATFFTFKKRDRAVLLPATFVLIVILALLCAAFWALNWSFVNSLQNLWLSASTQSPPNDERNWQIVSQMFGFMGWAFLFMFPIYLAVAAYEAACLRWMIRGEAPGLFGMTINNDVWRVWGVYWCWLLAQMAISMAMSFLMVPVMFMMMGDIMRNPTPEAMTQWQLSVQLPLTLLQYIPLIFLGIRFGPAAATSIVRNRFSFFEAWTVTRGRFCSLFGSHFLLWVVLGVVLTVVVGGAYAIALRDLLPRMLADWPSVTPQEIAERVLTPRGLTVLGMAYAAYAVSFLIYAAFAFGINARAALVAVDEGKVEHVPDEV